MKVLVTGWFSFEDMGTTAGDIIACELVCDWLKNHNIEFDIASKQHALKGIIWEKTDPNKYSHLIFVCGPFGNGWPLTNFLEHFKRLKLIGLNLSMLQSLKEWNPFNYLIERDSDVHNNPDIVFGAEIKKVPVVGIIKAHQQKEYGERAMHGKANKAIQDLICSREMAVVNIDTSIEENHFGLKTAHEIESVISKMDLVVTTRLHGLVLSLKNGIPVIAIDPILGGAKVTRQSEAVNWPYLAKVDQINQQEINKLFDACLTEEAILMANQSGAYAKKLVEGFESKVKEYLFKSSS